MKIDLWDPPLYVCIPAVLVMMFMTRGFIRLMILSIIWYPVPSLLIIVAIGIHGAMRESLTK